MASQGCRKFAFWGAIGCLAVPIGLAILIAITLFVGQKLGKSGPQHPVASEVTVPVSDSPAIPQPSPGSTGAPAGPVVPGKDMPQLDQPVAPAREVKPLSVTLDLAEGDFTIQPGPPGTDIKVEGFFDPKSYELTQSTTAGEGGGRDIHIGFRRNTPFFFLLLSENHPENKVTITLPQGVPTTLNLRMSKCQSRIELGGLTVNALDARLTMGDQSLSFSRPNAGRIENAVLVLKMGDIKLRGLGNSRADTMSLRGSMGDIRVNFDGDWEPGSKMSANVMLSMGDFRVLVPRDVRLKTQSIIFLGESRGRRDQESQPEDPNAPILEIEARASMGDLSISRD